MYRTIFSFALRDVAVDHGSFCRAITYARHVLAMWPNTIHEVGVFGDRRDNYPTVLIVKRKTA
jgi:hypothetical protein